MNFLFCYAGFYCASILSQEKGIHVLHYSGFVSYIDAFNQSKNILFIELLSYIVCYPSYMDNLLIFFNTWFCRKFSLSSQVQRILLK